MAIQQRTVKDFSKLCHSILRSDRDCNIGLGGYTGEGKSNCLTQIFKEYSKISGMKWNYNYMTWSRKELLEWIDGKKGGKILSNGLKEKQLPEYSAIALDELWLLFYKRNWYDEAQINSLATLNYCRDRHILVGGNVPNFWDLDAAFTSRIRFYIYIPTRSIAWIFEQENNPFATDPWNKTLNKKLFRKYKNPYGMPNFLMEIKFPDWTPKEKIRYYEIRNKKRVMAIDQNKDEKKERYGEIKKQRDKLIKLLINNNREILEHREIAKKLGIGKLTYKDLADILGITKTAVRYIDLGER